ncbi:MAG: mannose-1-phosphate guanylyltransferase [Saprospirales bacterium]|nr:MAG: mannose-1-phosphate guanylyltransferase [Saprospirales bacterium]
MTKQLYAAIMAGGSGTRFWPASRKAHPKQFLDVNQSGQTLLQKTYNRFKSFVEEDKIKVVSIEDYADAILEQTGRGEGVLIEEPMMRNTAAAVALSAFEINLLNPEAIMIMSPADHLIEDEKEFRESIERCTLFAEKNDALITIGIQPSSAHTGYGYIKRGKETGQLFEVSEFTEKPVKLKAEEFLQSGEYFWNAGIFVWSIKSILKAFFECAPEIYEPLATLYKKGRPQLNELREVYSKLPSISVDYAILEKADNVFTCPSNPGWSDLGSWKTIFDISEADDQGNVRGKSRVTTHDSSGCFIRGKEGKLYALIGMKDIGIVDMEDVTMIFPLSRDQDVKVLLEKVRRVHGSEFD